MRPVSRLILVGLSVLAVVAGCSGQPATRVLFVGNSFTSYNELPRMVSELGASAGHRVEAAVMAPGEWWWRDHARSPKTLGLIESEEWDFVVLQEQSMVPAIRDMAIRESRPAAVELATRAVGQGSRVVLYMTWGHRNGNPDTGHSSYESMQIAIAGTYSDIGAAVAGRVAPVGMAWWMARSERPDIVLYAPDGSHPSREGSYLAAAVIAGTLLRVDPLEFDHAAGLGEGTALALRQFASRALDGEVPWRG